MRLLLLPACLALAHGGTHPTPYHHRCTLLTPSAGSSKLSSTPLHSGGGRIVGGTDADVGEFPHQIMLTRGV